MAVFAGYYLSCYSILPAAFPTLWELGTVRLYFCACSINQCLNLLLVREIHILG